MPEDLLRFENVGKQFNGVAVLDNISFSLGRGEILGLVGENGAGKSTLMKILFGMAEIAETGGFDGKIYFDGQYINFLNPLEALKSGIGMVHQEFSLIPGFTVTENVLLNMERTKPSVISKILGKKLETLNRTLMKSDSKKAIDMLGVRIDTETRVSETPVGHKQFIEIAREINRDQIKLLVLDEPTAVLTESEAEILLDAMRRLAGLGVSVIFISHRLNEISATCDKLVVLRDGAVIEERPADGVNVRQIAEWMVGRDIGAAQSEVAEGSSRPAMYANANARADTNVNSASSANAGDDAILDVKNLWVDMPGETVKDVSFSVNRGEIFGIGGLTGQGKLGVPNGIMGLSPSGGSVMFKGKPLRLNNTPGALKSGIAYVSEDRRGVGLLMDEPVFWNIPFNAMQVQGKYIKKLLGGLICWRDEKAMRQCSNDYIDKLDIKCTDEGQRVKQLSGGNQQKICLAKALAQEPSLLFVSEPTRGIDVGAKKTVLDTLRQYNKESNTTIVMISSELEELRAICGRIAVVSEGRICGVVPAATSTVDFGLLMAGQIAS